MLIPFSDLVRDFDLHGKISGVLHCGAHTGEEAERYHEIGVRRVVWIEGNAETIPALQAHLDRFAYDNQEVVCAVLSDQPGQELTFRVTRDPEGTSMSSSILELEYHKVVAPWVKEHHTVAVTSTTIDTLDKEHDFSGLNFINLDLQGAELLALKGGERFMKNVDYVYTEVNIKHLYTDCVLLDELDAWLGERGFQRVQTSMTDAAWGDAFYMRMT